MGVLVTNCPGLAFDSAKLFEASKLNFHLRKKRRKIVSERFVLESVFADPKTKLFLRFCITCNLKSICSQSASKNCFRKNSKTLIYFRFWYDFPFLYFLLFSQVYWELAKRGTVPERQKCWLYLVVLAETFRNIWNSPTGFHYLD